ncbi:unnamed protein product, partial [Heterotrigona itama]
MEGMRCFRKLLLASNSTFNERRSILLREIHMHGTY